MDNSIIRKTKINAIYMTVTQIVITIIGVLKSFLLPLVLPSVESYAYWQIYLFYISYVLFFSFGFHEGIYLKFGGYDYDKLPFEKMRTSIRLQYITLALMTTILCILILFEKNPNKRFALLFVSLNLFTSGTIDIYTRILQITNQIKKYCIYNMVDKVLFGIMLLVFLLLGKVEFKLVIVLDFSIRLVVTIALMIKFKKLWRGNGVSLTVGFLEWKNNISIGIKLMIASYMAILITGLGRWIVEMLGDLKDYAYYSFGITAVNLVLVMFASISTVLYPVLKRICEEKYSQYFLIINKLLMIINIILLLLYFPICYIINLFIPTYAPATKYLGILMCVVVIQCKTELGSAPFFKALRKEFLILTINMISVVVFILLAYVLYSARQSIMMIALATLIAMIFRGYISEIYLMTIFKTRTYQRILIEIGTMIVFVLITTFASKLTAFCGYSIYTLTMCIIFHKTIREGKSLIASSKSAVTTLR